MTVDDVPYVSWYSKRHPRSNRNSWIAKQRWSRTLRPKPLFGPRLPRMPNAPDWLSRRQDATALFGLD